MPTAPNLPAHVRAIVDEIETEIGEEPRRAAGADRGRRARTPGNGRVEAAVHEILTEIGEDPERQGLLGTPERVHRMYTELTAGYHVDPDRLINGAIFDVAYSEMVVVKDIPFYSLCEHHLLPFFGQAAVAYIPRGRVIGLSKIPRVVEMYSRRLQVQERLTQQIADFLQERLEPQGVGVVIEATHLCAVMRGVRKPGHDHDDVGGARPLPDPRPDARRVLRPPRPAGAGGVARAVALEVPIPLTARLAARIVADHAEPDRAMIIAALERVDLGDWLATHPPDGRERVLAAILVLIRGDPGRLARSIGIAERDWRNALVWAELGQPDWPARLDEMLGPG